MQTAEQIIAGYQQLLGAMQYDLATARNAAQQLSAQLTEAQAAIERLKDKPSSKTRGKKAAAE